MNNMVDMARTPEEFEGEPTVPDQPIYPYGLSLTLTSEELQKLGLDCEDEDCMVGNYLHLFALAEVTGIHKTETVHGSQTVLNVQITHMACESEDEENEEYDGEMNEGRVLRQSGPY